MSEVKVVIGGNSGSSSPWVKLIAAIITVTGLGVLFYFIFTRFFKTDKKEQQLVSSPSAQSVADITFVATDTSTQNLITETTVTLGDINLGSATIMNTYNPLLQTVDSATALSVLSKVYDDLILQTRTLYDMRIALQQGRIDTAWAQIRNFSDTIIFSRDNVMQLGNSKLKEFCKNHSNSEANLILLYNSGNMNEYCRWIVGFINQFFSSTVMASIKNACLSGLDGYTLKSTLIIERETILNTVTGEKDLYLTCSNNAEIKDRYLNRLGQLGSTVKDNIN